MISGNKRKKKTLCCLLKGLKGKTLPDNHVKLTYNTVTNSFPPQLLGNETFLDIIINGIDDLHVFGRTNC